VGGGARERGDNIRISFWDILLGYHWIITDKMRYYKGI
jgi:hypothetical protein